MELSVAPSSAQCAATTISSSFSKWCPFPVSVSQTQQMLEEVSLLRGGSLNVRPAQLRNPTLCLGKALWPRPSRAPNPCSWFGSHGQQLVLCTVHSFHGLPMTRPLFLSHGSLVLTSFQDVRAGEPDVEPPSRRVR